MARTLIDNRFIKDENLTGASFAPELGFFDETRDYAAGEKVFFNGERFYTKNAITGLTEGDLSNAPSDTNTNFGKLGGKARTYTSGELYEKDEIFVDPDSNKIYVAKQEFTASGDLVQDYQNGYCDTVALPKMKQMSITANSGDTVTINLENPNVNHDRLCQVLQFIGAQNGVDKELLSFSEYEDYWGYNDTWVFKDGTMGLKKTVTYDTTYQNSLYFEKEIDTADYNDIITISGVMLI